MTALGHLLRRPLSFRWPTLSRHIMTRPCSIDASPPIHRGMSEKLDRDAFRKTIQVLAARVPPAKTGSILRSEPLKRTIMDLPRIPSVVMGPEGDRLVLFRFQNQDELPEDAKRYLESQSAPLTTHTIELKYDYWTAEDIITAILPEDLLEEAPSGFAVVGHIAHLNLRDEYLPYKNVIGEIILDKVSRIRTVVNKLNTISNKFRVFDMELLAGEPDYLVEHSESNCKFTFDFAKVYWNSRLHTEHGRLVDMFKPEDVIADVFAGVGPFALPAAKKGCGVFANDLNPESYKYLQANVQNNHVQSLVRTSCEDGKEFIRAVIARALDDPFPAATPPLSKTKRLKEQRQARERGPEARNPSPSPVVRRSRVTQFVMNLPDSAILFLSAFRGVLSSRNAGGRDLSGVYEEMPVVHCYCFTREDGAQAEIDIRRRVEAELGHALGDDVGYHYVRKVAPKKEMYCISFRLPREVAFEA